MVMDDQMCYCKDIKLHLDLDVSNNGILPHPGVIIDWKLVG
jgi:hypothetical protein